MIKVKGFCSYNFLNQFIFELFSLREIILVGQIWLGGSFYKGLEIYLEQIFLLVEGYMFKFFRRQLFGVWNNWWLVYDIKMEKLVL